MSAQEAAAAAQQPNKCSRCGCTDTPQWRRQGEQLVCNACGIKIARQLRRARQPGDGNDGEGQPAKAARTNGRGSRSGNDSAEGAGGRGRGRGGGGQQPQHAIAQQHLLEGQVQVGTSGGLVQLLAGGVAPAHGPPPTPHAWNIDNLLGSNFELWDFDLPHHQPGETPMAAAAVDSVFVASGATAGAGGVPLQPRQPVPVGAVPLALAQPVPVAGEAAAPHGVPALLLPSGSVGQQWGPGQQHAAAVEQHHLDQLHLQRHHQLQVQLQEAEVSSSALAEEPASRPRPLPATGSNHSAAAEVEGGSGSRGAGVRANSHYDAQQHCRQEVIAPPTAHPSPRQPARRGSGSLAGLSPNSDGCQTQGQQQQQQQAGGLQGDGMEPSPRWEEYCPPQYQNDSGSVHQPAAAPPGPPQQQQQQQQQYGSCGGHPPLPGAQPMLVRSQPEHAQQPAQQPAQQQQHGSFHRSSSQQTLMGSQQTLMARLPLSAALAPLPAQLCHDSHCSDPRCCGGMAAALAAQQQGGGGGGAAAAAPLANQHSQQLSQPRHQEQQGQQAHQQQQQSHHQQHSPPQEQWDQLHDRTPGVSLEGTRAALMHSSSCREARTSWHPPSQPPQQQQHAQQQPHPQPPQQHPQQQHPQQQHPTQQHPQQQPHLGGGQPPKRGGSAPPALVRRTPSWDSLAPQPYTLFGAEADGIPTALSRTLSAGNDRMQRSAQHAAARLAGDPLPGRVVKTLATLPDVQLLYQSRPGPRGVVLHHVYPGLTCTLQLVRVGASSGGGGGGCSPSEQSSGMLASGGGAGAESAGEAGAGRSGGGGGGGAPVGERLTTRTSLVNELSEVVVTFRDDVHPEEACVLPYMVRGCAAWDSGEGWLVLFEQFSQLHQFAGAIEQAARLVRGAS